MSHPCIAVSSRYQSREKGARGIKEGTSFRHLLQALSDMSTIIKSTCTIFLPWTYFHPLPILNEFCLNSCFYHSSLHILSIYLIPRTLFIFLLIFFPFPSISFILFSIFFWLESLVFINLFHMFWQIFIDNFRRLSQDKLSAVNRRRWSLADPSVRVEWHRCPTRFSVSPIDANVRRGSCGSPSRIQADATARRVQEYPVKPERRSRFIIMSLIFIINWSIYIIWNI